MAERYYHPDYRQAEVQAIVGALDQGNSVSVIGPPSIGKSNLLQYLSQERLAAGDPISPWKRWTSHASTKGPIVTVSIDPNALLPVLPVEQGPVAARAWPGFELLTHRTAITLQLYPALNPATTPEADPTLAQQIAHLQERFASAHPEVTDFQDHLHAHLALRHLENIIDAALTSYQLQGKPVRIVYFMDEFERLLATLPDYFFVALRSLRDRFKYQVMFVTFTRNSLSYLIGDDVRMATLEPFIELLHDHTVYLTPFNDDDAWRMVEQLEKRAVSKDDHGLGLLIRAAGGFAGLIRAGFKHVDQLGTIQAAEYHQAVGQAASRLVAEPNVQAECKTLLRGLNTEEIMTLYDIVAQKTSLDQANLHELIHKSLVICSAPGEIVHLSPPVLAAYIRNHPTPPEAKPSVRPVTLPE